MEPFENSKRPESKNISAKSYVLAGSSICLWTLQSGMKQNPGTAIRVYSSKQVFLQIWQISKENTCVGVSRLQHKCFPVKFTEFLRTPFFTEHLRWLLLKISLIQIIFQLSLQLQISKVDNIYIDLLPRCCHLPNFFKGAEVANGVFFKKGVLKNFANFTGKHRCQSLFKKVAGLQACQTCNFIKKRLQHRCFPMKLAKFLRTPILKNICKRLFLQKPSSPLYPEHFKY